MPERGTAKAPQSLLQSIFGLAAFIGSEIGGTVDHRNLWTQTRASQHRLGRTGAGMMTYEKDRTPPLNSEGASGT